MNFKQDEIKTTDEHEEQDYKDIHQSPFSEFAKNFVFCASAFCSLVTLAVI